MADGKRRYKSDRKDYKISVKLSEKDMEKIRNLDTGESLILKIRSLDEVYRLHGIRFEQ